MPKHSWFAALVILAGLAAPAFGQTTLKWKFEKGKTFYQKMTTETKQTMKVMGSDIKQDQKQVFVFSWTPEEEKSDGSWVIKQKIEAVEMDIDIGGNKIKYDSSKDSGTQNPLGEFFKALVGSEFTLTVAADKDKGGYKVTKVEGRDEFLKKLVQANPQMEPLLKQILSDEALKQMADPTFAALPNKEVKKDDTWKRTSELKMGPIGKYDNEYTYKYEGKDDKDKALDKIKVETTLKYTPPTESEAASGLPFKIKSADLKSTDAGGTIWVNAEKGRVEKSDTNIKLEGTLKIEIGGQMTDVTLSQTQKTTVETSDKNPSQKAS